MCKYILLSAAWCSVVLTEHPQTVLLLVQSEQQKLVVIRQHCYSVTALDKHGWFKQKLQFSTCVLIWNNVK